MKQLSIESEGRPVEVLQLILSENGQELSLTGIFDEATDIAVRQFQQAQNLVVDGIVGNKTWAAIYEKAYSFKLKAKSDFLPDHDFIAEYFPKNCLYLHHTAGGARPDWTIAWWRNDNKDKDGNFRRRRVGTAFVIGREGLDGGTTFDGKIYRAFKEAHWAYHLGVNEGHTGHGADHNKQLNQQAIGIEICSYGPLIHDEDTGKFFYEWKTEAGIQRREIPEDQVCTLEQPWRGFTHFQKYTPKQIEACKELILSLSYLFAIPLPERTYTPDWFEIDQDAKDGKPGIWTHANVRPGKSDCFPQPELIDMLNSLHEAAKDFKLIPDDVGFESTETELPDFPVDMRAIQHYTVDLDDAEGE
ncbi:MAG: peptidoglycan-binding protein [Bacteroidota bacterium]